MKEKALPVIALIVSVIAITMVIAGSPNKKNTSPSIGVNAEIDRLTERLKRLEGKLKKATALAQSTPKATSSFTPRAERLDENGQPIAPATQDLESLQARQVQLEGHLYNIGVIEYFEARKKRIDDSYARAINPEGDVRDRLSALDTLDRYNKVDEALVESAMPLWEESLALEGREGSRIRAELLDSLDGTTNPTFRTNIIEWIQDEPSSRMRERGLRTLGYMIADTNVQEWVRYLRENDSSESVRRRAQSILDRQTQ